MKIIYTHTDEAPALATQSLLPIVAGVRRRRRRRGRAARHLARRPDPRPVPRPPRPTSQRVADALAELGELANDARGQHHQAARTSAPRCRSSRRRSPSSRSRATRSPTTPTSRPTTSSARSAPRYDRVKGSAVNPVLREGNSDRRAPASVKDYARQHPHSMGAWSPDSRSHVSTMSDGDFRSTERSVTVDARRRRCGSSTSPPTARSPCSRQRSPVLAGEVLDAAVMRRAALEAFLAEQVADAKRQGVLFSVHLKATMMKVSDPIIFGHAVRAYFPIVFAEHAAALRRAGVDANDGLARAADRRSRRCPRTSATAIRARDRGRLRATARRWRWSTPTAGSPTCTCPAT